MGKLEQVITATVCDNLNKIVQFTVQHAPLQHAPRCIRFWKACP